MLTFRVARCCVANEFFLRHGVGTALVQSYDPKAPLARRGGHTTPTPQMHLQ